MESKIDTNDKKQKKHRRSQYRVNIDIDTGKPMTRYLKKPVTRYLNRKAIDSLKDICHRSETAYALILNELIEDFNCFYKKKEGFIMNYEDKSRATADVLSGSTDTTDWSIEESVSIISQEIHPPKATASEYDIFGEQNKAVTFYANIKEWEMFESNCDDAGVYSSSMLVYLIEQFNRDVALKRLESAVAQDKAEQINQLFKKK